MKCLLIFVLILLINVKLFAQFQKVEQFILNNDFDSAWIELRKQPKTDYSRSLANILSNRASTKDYAEFIKNIRLVGEAQYKKLDSFIEKTIAEPKDSKIDLNYVEIKWQQINNQRNELLFLKEATAINSNLKKYISQFDREDPDVKKAMILALTDDIVLHMINGNLKKQEALCLDGIRKSTELRDTSLIIMSKYFYSDVLVKKNRLEDFIENCQQILALEEKSSSKSPFYELNIVSLLDAMIYKGDFDPQYIMSILKELYTSPGYTDYSYKLYAKFLTALPKESETFKQILLQFECTDLPSFCKKIYQSSQEKVNSNELFHLSWACSSALMKHGYYEEAMNFKDECINITKKTYSKELSQSIADMQTQEVELEKNAQLEKEKQKSIYMWIIMALITFFFFISVILLYRLRIKTRILVKQSREKEVLLREIHHRVKNNFQLIIAFMRLEQKFAHEMDTGQFIGHLELKLNSMSMVHEMLYQDSNIEKIELKRYLIELTEAVASSIGNDKCDLDIEINGDEMALDIDQAIPIGLAINEVITNSVKHAERDELEIKLSILKTGTNFLLTVKDNGIGFPDDFDPERSESLGIRVINLLMKQISGKVSWKNEQGAAWFFIIPIK